MGTGICPFCGKEVDKFIMFRGDIVGCRYCEIHTKRTNADRIRAMSDEKLAEFFGTLPCCPPGEDLEELCFPLDSCEGTDFKVKCWLKWLRQEAEEK